MTAMLLIPAAVCIVLVVMLASVLPDRRLSREHAPQASGLAFLSSLKPRDAPDFVWVCAGRFFLILCMSFLTAYQPFFLMSRLGFSAQDVPDFVFRSTLVQSTAVVLAGLIAGRLSDLTRRRKPFVIGAALACAAGSWLIAMAPSYGAFLAGIALFGVGLGGYLSVDFALVTDVLPNKENDAAKDLGLFNIASALPQCLAPLVALRILAATGGSYPAVFAAAAVVAVFSAAAILPVRRVR